MHKGQSLMDIKFLINKLKVTPDCAIAPANGIPEIELGHTLPLDVQEFYQYCGGLSLYKSADYPISIVSPEEFVLANPVIIGEKGEGDITANWYIVAKDINGDHLSVDLHNGNRLGRCYDSFWDRHGVVGSCPIIALSFTELLKNLVDNYGKRPYWLENEFISLGDAYDDE